MKIQSFVYVRDGLTYCDGSSPAYNIEFYSFPESAVYFRKLLSYYDAEMIMVFFDSFRYALVTVDSCDFHYHINFKEDEKED